MITIVKEINSSGAWWFNTPADAYKDLQNIPEYGSLPLRQDFIDIIDNGGTVFLNQVQVFIAYEGDQ